LSSNNPSIAQEEMATYYVNKENATSILVRIEEDTVWLTQQQMMELFDSTKQNISLHINNIFKEGELDKNSVVKYSLTTASDGKKYKVTYYNLTAINKILELYEH